MFEVRQSAVFSAWLAELRDLSARLRIAARVRRMEEGHLGDTKTVGSGVRELRMNFGPGYRVYYVQRGQRIVVLLCGGDKDSQKSDIIAAKRMAKEV